MQKDLYRQLAIKSFDNAKELHEEAKLLYDNKHYSRCIFLSQIGGEELGKHFICSSSYIQRLLGRLNESKFRKRFYDHRTKTSSINHAEDFLLDVINNRLKKDSYFLKDNTDIESLEQIKLRSLYTDFFDDGSSAKPSDIYERKFAHQALKWLSNRIKLFEKIGVIKIFRKGELNNLVNMKEFEKMSTQFNLKKEDYYKK